MVQFGLHWNTFRLRITDHKLQHKHSVTTKSQLVLRQPTSATGNTPLSKSSSSSETTFTQSVSHLSLVIADSAGSSHSGISTVLTIPEGSRGVFRGACGITLKLTAAKMVTVILCGLKHKPEHCQEILQGADWSSEEANTLKHAEELHIRQCLSMLSQTKAVGAF